MCNTTRTNSVSDTQVSTPRVQIKLKVGNILTKVKSLRINIDDDPEDSHSHEPPSHLQTTHLLFNFLSLGIPFPLPTKCV